MTKKCHSCDSEAIRLDPQAATKRLETIDDWRYDKNTPAIIKTYKFKGFYKAIAFVNAVAWIAQAQGHHPDISIHYNQVTLSLTSHEAGGLTENDFISARQIDTLFQTSSNQ